VAVVVGVLAIVSPRFGSVGNDASPTPSPTMRSPGIVLPGGPEAFAGDPRLGTCTVGALSDMEYAFVMARGRDYRRYFPAMLLSPELEIDTPVFVIVYREGFEPVFGGVPGAVRPTPRPGHRTVCAVVDGERIVYGDVDITGMTVDVAAATPLPSPSPSVSSPGNPYAWLDDSRLPKCYFTGRPNRMDYVFEITTDRDYGLFVRNPGLERDLEEHGVALVVVYRADMPYPPDFGPGPQAPPHTPPPGQRVVCMVFEDGVLSQTGLDITSLELDALPNGPTATSGGPTPVREPGPVSPTPASPP